MLLTFLIIFIASVITCAMLTRYVRDSACSHGWTDPPELTRHIHENPVPRLGGVAIFLTVMFISTAGVLARRWERTPTAFSIHTTFAILGPAALIFLTGLYDDFHNLGPYVKFGAQIVAACVLYVDGMGIHKLAFLPQGRDLNVALGLPLTIVWVLLITNAFNLIDGLDGLSAGSALFSTTVLVISSLLLGNHYIAFLAAVLAGAILGFLRFNFNPATIFLGDSGSLLIGFLLSALALASSQKASTMIAVAIPVVCFGLPILDVAIAVMRRFLNGKPLFQGDREHIHHKLLKRGFHQREAVLILYGVSALFGLLSLALLQGGETMALVLVSLTIGLWVGIPQLRYQEFKEMRRVLDRTTSQKRIIVNNLYVRRATEALESCEDPSDLWRILADALRPSEFDGFGLRLPAPFWLPRPLPPGARENAHGEVKFSWTTATLLDESWELKLELVDKDGEKCGSFSVYKRITGKPLMMDINLLSDGFQSALACAVRRVILDRESTHVEYERSLTSGKAKVASA